MKLILICSLTLLLMGCDAMSKPSSPAPKNWELDGEWLVVAIDSGGTPAEKDRVTQIGLSYTFEKGQLTIKRGDHLVPDEVHSLMIDFGSKPKRLSIFMNNVPPIPAIYELDGDTLRICSMVDASPNASFPKEFVSIASPKTDLLTMKRQPAK